MEKLINCGAGVYLLTLMDYGLVDDLCAELQGIDGWSFVIAHREDSNWWVLSGTDREVPPLKLLQSDFNEIGWRLYAALPNSPLLDEKSNHPLSGLFRSINVRNRDALKALIRALALVHLREEGFTELDPGEIKLPLGELDRAFGEIDMWRTLASLREGALENPLAVEGAPDLNLEWAPVPPCH